MSYKYLTQYNSPNYTSNAQTLSAFGMARKIEGITIHHWGDPRQNPQFMGIVNYLCRAGGNSSAHFVATGTDRQVACIVSPSDTAWHAGNAWGNARTIGIELDPRARNEDYDVAAELIADIRSAYGDVPIYWHSYFVATACPGAWDADRLDKLSYTKYSHATEWGQGGNKAAVTIPEPTPTPQPANPAPVVLVSTATFDTPRKYTIMKDTTLVNIPDGSKYGTRTYKATETIDNIVEMQTYSNGAKFYRTAYARDTAKKQYGFHIDMLQEILPSTPSPTAGGKDTGVPVADKSDYKDEYDELRGKAAQARDILTDALK